jgi:hypothetical protein
MDRKQVQALYETVMQVRHALAGILSSQAMVIEEFDTLSPEVKTKFEDAWHKTCLQVIQDLSGSLDCFAQASQVDTPSLINAPPANENG